MNKGEKVLGQDGVFLQVAGGLLWLGLDRPAIGFKLGAQLVFKEALGVDVGSGGHGLSLSLLHYRRWLYSFRKHLQI